MSTGRFTLRLLRLLALLATLLCSVPYSGQAAADMEELLPLPVCGTEWKVEGKPLFYDRDSLSDRINGEAELYMPYGFDRMAAARYSRGNNTPIGMDVEIYRLGTTLDAFGMFANYRQNEGRTVAAGTESNLSGSQLFFYQGRHFIHIQITGGDNVDSDAMIRCAKVVATRVPGPAAKAAELRVLDLPEVIKGTERYLPQSLLGYDFLNRGLMADAEVEGASLQILRLLGLKGEPATMVFDRFLQQVTQGQSNSPAKDVQVMEGIDPLYGPVMILKKGDCLAGALKFKVKKGVAALLERVCR
ncbi:MAG TPA: hypothetical protein HPP76_03685 [Desulfuromonadales bacterium]|nr:hypothetical protein [Desulfuromonadales bacterium]